MRLVSAPNYADHGASSQEVYMSVGEFVHLRRLHVLYGNGFSSSSKGLNPLVNRRALELKAKITHAEWLY